MMCSADGLKVNGSFNSRIGLESAGWYISNSVDVLFREAYPMPGS